MFPRTTPGFEPLRGRLFDTTVDHGKRAKNRRSGPVSSTIGIYPTRCGLTPDRRRAATLLSPGSIVITGTIPNRPGHLPIAHSAGCAAPPDRLPSAPLLHSSTDLAPFPSVRRMLPSRFHSAPDYAIPVGSTTFADNPFPLKSRSAVGDRTCTCADGSLGSPAMTTLFAANAPSGSTDIADKLRQLRSRIARSVFTTLRDDPRRLPELLV